MYAPSNVHYNCEQSSGYLCVTVFVLLADCLKALETTSPLCQPLSPKDTT